MTDFDIFCKIFDMTDDINATVVKSETDSDDNFIIFDSREDAMLAQELFVQLYPEAAALMDFDDFPKDQYDERVLDWAEVNWGYADEWSVCSCCGKAFQRIESTGNHGHVMLNGDLVCDDCLSENEEIRDAYIDEMLNDPACAVQHISDSAMIEAGFELVDEGCNSFYGDDDDPYEMFQKHFNKDQDGKYVFSIRDEHNPFSTSFALWKKVEEDENG